MFKSLLRVYDGTGYLVLFSTEKYDGIYKKIRYLISIKKVQRTCKILFANDCKISLQMRHKL